MNKEIVEKTNTFYGNFLKNIEESSIYLDAEEVNLLKDHIKSLEPNFVEDISKIIFTTPKSDLPEYLVYEIIRENIINILSSWESLMLKGWDTLSANYVEEYLTSIFKKTGCPYSILELFVIDEHINLYDENYYEKYLKEFYNGLNFNEIPNGYILPDKTYKTRDGQLLIDVSL